MTAMTSSTMASDVTLSSNTTENQTAASADDTIKVDQSISSSGTISGFKALTITSGKTLTNTGTIDVGHYGDSSVTDATLDNQGSIAVKDTKFELNLVNSGKITSTNSSLEFNRATFKKGSEIVDTNGNQLKKIAINYLGKDATVVESGAELKADDISITHAKALTVDGSILGDNINIGSCSEINLTQNAYISGNNVTIENFITQNPGTNPAKPSGGTIKAAQKLVLSSNVYLKDIVLDAPSISAAGSAYITGNSELKNVQRLEIGNTLTLADASHVENNYIPEVVLQAMTVNNAKEAPRLQLEGTQPLSIGTLIVGKSTTTSGTVFSGKIVDKMTSGESGSTSFSVDNVIVEDGAKLSVYADDKKEGAPETKVQIGTLTAGKDSVVELGWRSEGTENTIAEKEIKTLILSENAKLDGNSDREGATTAESAVIGEIVFAGNNASVTNTLTGSSTKVTVAKGVSGASLAKVETSSLTAVIEDTSTANALKVESVNDTTAVTLVGSKDNNTGNAAADLTAVKNAVDLGEKTANVTVSQEADDIHDGATATVTENGGITNVQTQTNTSVHGVAEMAALGLHVWRNEINDMNKRLGELRDSSAESNGVWARVYNGKARMGKVGVKNKYTALQLGYDRQIASGFWLGGAFSYTDGDNTFRTGSGDSSLFAFTGYGSWLLDNGMFLDVTGKVGRMKNTFDVASASGTSSASYHTNAASMSAEAGWRLPLTNLFFVEPQVEVMWGHVADVDYRTSVGVEVNQDSVESLIGRAGLVLGVNCPNQRGNAYVRASVLHDWKGEADFRFGKNGQTRALSEDLGGTWYEYGIGANFNLTKQTHLYADLEAASGGEVDTDYRVNLGVRYVW